MRDGWVTLRLALAALAAAALLVPLAVDAWAQGVPVTVEVASTEQPTEPGATPTEPGSTPTAPGAGPSQPPTAPPPPGGEPPPAAPDPTDDPLPRTGADLLRLVRDAAALVAAGLLLLRVTQRPRREPR